MDACRCVTGSPQAAKKRQRQLIAASSSLPVLHFHRGQKLGIRWGPNWHNFHLCTRKLLGSCSGGRPAHSGGACAGGERLQNDLFRHAVGGAAEGQQDSLSDILGLDGALASCRE